MFITCAISRNVPYKDKDGVLQLVTLRPGRHNYPMLDPKNDPLLSDTLRVLRKHHHISFDDLLPSDKEVLKDCPPDQKPVDFLAEKVLLKPSPVGRSVCKKKGKKNAVGNKKDAKKAGKVEKSEPGSAEQGKVSDKK
jgi:hypothetical protein